MASAPSFKELTKALHTFLPTASLPLPKDLVDIIEGYVQKHEAQEEGVSQKLHEELISVYEKDVLGHPSRYASFLNILRRLRPLIAHPERTVKWWELLQPFLAHMSEEKDLVEEGQTTILDILTADWGDDANNPGGGAALPLAERLVQLWLEDCAVAGRAEDFRVNFREKQVRETLMMYGKKRPRDFMTVVGKFMAKQECRARTLHLMSDFIRNRPPHLYQILHTPLFGNLVNCLQLDTSTTIVSLALTVLTMVLPHMPSSLVPHLPTLFNIYARLLFWDRELSAAELGFDLPMDRRLSASDASWEKKTYSSELDDTRIPQLSNYFTILYGLYPINFMDYIRKPQRYLRHAEVSNSDDIEIQPTEIRHASEQFRLCHVLHENFYTLTIDSEKTDFGRWIKSEPAEVVADCMALRQSLESPDDSLASQFGMHEPPALSIKGETDKDGLESALLSTSNPLAASAFDGLQSDSWHSTQTIPVGSPSSSRVPFALFRQPSQSSHQSQRDSSSTRPSGKAGDSPNLPPTSSFTNLQDMINSNKVIKSSLNQSLANDSVPSLALSHQESIPDRPLSTARSVMQPTNLAVSSVSTLEDKDAQIRHLYRQILLLHNDLTFARFMKQQHLTHMGELRRRQVREAASEADAQNLIMANRHLKKRLEEARKVETQVKKDSEKSRNLAKKWEADLSSKLRTIREEQKKWLVEGETLREELAKTKAEANALVKLICDAEVKENGWKQQLQYIEASTEEMERLKSEVKRLAQSERNLQSQEAERQAAMTRAVEADGRAEMMQKKLDAQGIEFQQTRELYESQAVVLNAKLQDALKNGTERRAEGLKAHLDSVLASSRAQQAELNKRLADLTRKNTALNATLLDLQSQVPTRSVSDPSRPRSPDSDSPSENDHGPLSSRNRQHRGFSDPETFDSTYYNPTPPLEPHEAVLSSSFRPSTPAGTEASGSTAGKTSPAVERYHGRGGLQNQMVIKKERKDKNADKEKKKSSGIRGIRGFV
ncbi:Tuberous sclerosis 1-like protein [Seiridium cupressi]